MNVNLCLEILTLYGNEFRLFGAKALPYSYYWCHAYDIAAQGTTFNVFSNDAVWAIIEHRGQVRASRPIPSIEFKTEHQEIGLPRPSTEPITFPCRADDTLRVMPRTWALDWFNRHCPLYIWFISNNSKGQLSLKLSRALSFR